MTNTASAATMIDTAVRTGMSSRSVRRFIVVRVHNEDFRSDIVFRSDSVDKARKMADRGYTKGGFRFFVIDSVDGVKVYG